MKLILTLAAGCLLAFQAAKAAEPFRMVVTGQSTGEITGEGPGGSIEGLAFQHEIVSPRDAASGLPTGRRQHKPFTIVKPIDKSTPLLHKLLTNTENAQVTLQFYRKSPETGETQKYYTITLTNASVSSIRDWKPNTRDLSAVRAGDLQEISFTYQKITWTYEDGGVTHEDDWSAPAT
jgi:type VI secretion system secreted protein Hcp